MRKTLLAASAALLLAAGPAVAQQKTIKIGFISTFSGPVAVIGNNMRDSFELALDHLGRKMGGLPVEVIYEDDAFKPEVGKQKTDKLIESDKVDFLTGYIWSNVLLASVKSALDSKTFLISANAGPHQLAGDRLLLQILLGTELRHARDPGLPVRRSRRGSPRPRSGPSGARRRSGRGRSGRTPPRAPRPRATSTR